MQPNEDLWTFGVLSVLQWVHPQQSEELLQLLVIHLSHKTLLSEMKAKNIEFNIGIKFANENLNQYCQITLFCVGDTFS
jgi:hypothetical protein